MAINVAKLSATAKRLIEENGSSMTFTMNSRTPADASKPWNGPSTSSTSYTAIGVRDEIQIADGKNDALKSPITSKLYVSKQSLDAAGITDATLLDYANDGTTDWKICYVTPISPSAADIIYIMGLEG